MIIRLMIRIAGLLLMILLGFSPNLKSQNVFHIKGKVVSGIDNEPLSEVIVHRKYSGNITQTNKNGEFILSNISPATFKIEFIGEGCNLDTTIVLNQNIDSLVIKLNDNNCFLNAESDIKNSKPKLFLGGGIAPVHQKGQEKTEQQFKFEYVEFGCNIPPQACMKRYSRIIFDYLDKIYGRKWRYAVRQDVLFLQDL